MLHNKTQDKNNNKQQNNNEINNNRNHVSHVVWRGDTKNHLVQFFISKPV